MLALARLGLRDFDVRANHPHADRAADRSDEKKKPSAHAVDQEDQEDQRKDSLDDSEDAGGEQARVCACDTDTVEDGRAVVVDSIDTGPVLPKE